MITRDELQQKLKELLVLSGRRWSCGSYGTPTQLDECIKSVDNKTLEIIDAFDEMVSELAVNLADIVDLKARLEEIIYARDHDQLSEWRHYDWKDAENTLANIGNRTQ